MRAIDRQSIRVYGIILAAGSAVRMGCPKQLLPYKQTTILGKVIETAKKSILDEVAVVLGHRARQIQKEIDFSGTKVLVNAEYTLGQSTSVKAGITHMTKGADAAMLLLGDQPTVDEAVINTLIQAFRRSLSPIVVPVYEGRRGNPVVIGRALFDELKSSLAGDSGARILFSKYPDKIQLVSVSSGNIHFDVDVMEDYRRLLALSQSENCSPGFRSIEPVKPKVDETAIEKQAKTKFD